MVWRSDRIIAVGTVNADAAFAFAHRPLERINENPDDEIHEKFWKYHMKRFLLFRSEFCFNVGTVVSDRWVIVILDSRLDFGGMTFKMSDEGDAFSRDALGSGKICRRLTSGHAHCGGEPGGLEKYSASFESNLCTRPQASEKGHQLGNQNGVERCRKGGCGQYRMQLGLIGGGEELEELRQRLSQHEVADMSTSRARGTKQCKCDVGLGQEKARPCGKPGENLGPLWWLIGLEIYDRNPSVCGRAVATGALARGC
jgi:hypothetical protein